MSSISIKIEVPEEALSALIRKELMAVLNQLKPQKQESVPEVLNFKEACKLLSCSGSLLYKLTSGRKIPHSKRGKKLVFIREELLEWLTQNKVEPEEETRQNALSLLTNRKRR